MAARNAVLQAELETHRLEKKAEESFATARAIESDPAAGSRSSRVSAKAGSNLGNNSSSSGLPIRGGNPKAYLTPEMLRDHDHRARSSAP